MSTCATCRFYLADGAVCRRYPPAAELTWVDLDAEHHTRSYSSTSFFPPMKPEGWCGEWAMVREAMN